MKISPEERAAAKQARAEAEANLACEGIYLTDAEREMFARFDEEGLSDEECIRRIITQNTPARTKVAAGD